MGRKGGDNRTRAQKHQNRTVYKPNLYGESKKMGEVRSKAVTNVCLRCAEKIEWRKKYDKYKPLTQPASCTGCGERVVRKAYHTLCDPCADARGVCAKCGQKEETIIPPEPTEAERLRAEIEERRMLESMKERERRAHFRAIERAKAAEREGDEETEEPGNDDEGEAAAESAPTDVDTAANGAEEATAATAAASQDVGDAEEPGGDSDWEDVDDAEDGDDDDEIDWS